MSYRIRCHVFEVPAEDHWLAGRGRGAARELLPWADPYIASLMRRLDDRYGGGDEIGDESDPFSHTDESAGAAFDDAWQEDAFMPRPIEPPRIHSYPPVYGGFPLLEDA